MADMVAWSPIRVGKSAEGDKPGETKVIKPGETVTKESLGDEEEFNQLVASGALKPLPYPEMPETYQDSPVNFLREQARKAADDALLTAETSEENISAIQAANLASTGQPQAEPLSDEVEAELKKQMEAEGQPTGGTAVQQQAEKVGPK